MSKTKKALGKGLGSLIKTPNDVSNVARGATRPKSAEASEPDSDSGTSSDVVASGEAVRNLDLALIVPSPFQPRRRFSEDAIRELMESIREHGVIQPLIVREVGGKFELIAGERRFRACQQLGDVTEVPAILRNASDRDVLELALIENLQREDLNPIEEAEAYRRLAREFELRQEDIAKRVGKNRATVANAMRLLDLDDEVQSLLAQGRISNGHAKAILGLKSPAEQCLVAEMVVRKKMTVRDTEREVNRLNKGGSRELKPEKPSIPTEVVVVRDKLRSRLATNVSIAHGDKKGKIQIEYYGSNDLERILELLGVDLDS